MRLRHFSWTSSHWSSAFARLYVLGYLLISSTTHFPLIWIQFIRLFFLLFSNKFEFFCQLPLSTTIFNFTNFKVLNRSISCLFSSNIVAFLFLPSIAAPLWSATQFSRLSKVSFLIDSCAPLLRIWLFLFRSSVWSLYYLSFEFLSSFCRLPTFL